MSFQLHEMVNTSNYLSRCPYISTIVTVLCSTHNIVAPTVNWTQKQGYIETQGLQRMPVHAAITIWHLPELALLMGNVLMMMALTLLPIPSG